MTDDHVKARISQHFVEVLASRYGYKCQPSASPDVGVDLEVTRDETYVDPNGRTRHIDTGEYLHFQLKCTCENSVVRGASSLKYDLKVKNYNDLVHRRNANRRVPLALILLVLPDAKDNWVSVSADELAIRKVAYWYLPPVGSVQTPNVDTVRIEVPYSNALTLSFVDDRFREIYG